MLQGLERGRPMEIDSLVSVVQEMGRLTRIPTPALDAVLALVAQRAKIAGLYEGNVRPATEKSPFLHERVALSSALPRGLFRKGTASFPAKVHKIERARALRAGETEGWR